MQLVMLDIASESDYFTRVATMAFEMATQLWFDMAGALWQLFRLYRLSSKNLSHKVLPWEL